MKSGLIMEGGAMRGLFTAGVMDVLLENGIEFDGAVGVSAGAAFGCNYKSRQIGRVLRYNLDYCRDPRFCSFRSLIKTGDLYGADFCYRELPFELDLFDCEVYDSSRMEFHVVCTDVETGKPVYKQCDKVGEDLLKWIQASASMPLAAKIVEIDGMKLLDGGVSDSIPLRYFEDIGYDRNVVVLTQPQEYRKGPNKILPLLKAAFRKYPTIIETMAKRHENYNVTLEYVRSQEAAGRVLVIRPEAPLEIGKIEHDPEKIKAAYEAGRKAAEKKMNEVKEFLNK